MKKTSLALSTNYNRSPLLTAEEKNGLYEVQAMPQRTGYTPLHVRSLRHLLWPLLDAADRLNIHPSIVSPLLRQICSAMLWLNKPYWGWSAEEWKRAISLCPNAQQIIGAMIGVAYVLCDLRKVYIFPKFQQYTLACKLFGKAVVDEQLKLAEEKFLSIGYYPTRQGYGLRSALCLLFLMNESALLRDITWDSLVELREQTPSKETAAMVFKVANVLYNLKFLNRRFEPAKRGANPTLTTGVPTAWVKLVAIWRDKSLLTQKVREDNYRELLMMGRMMADLHPEVKHPNDWTIEIVQDAMVRIKRLKVGDYVGTLKHINPEKVGKESEATTKVGFIGALKRFFVDLQEWKLIEMNFNPERAFRLSKDLLNQLEADPRNIEEVVWLKLLDTVLSLTNEQIKEQLPQKGIIYPPELVRALCFGFVFSALRRNELHRLPIKSVWWYSESKTLTGDEAEMPDDTECELYIPPSKWRGEYKRPIPMLLGQALEKWEKVRPAQAPLVDKKTGQLVEYLFQYRGKLIGEQFTNKKLIPMLCKLAGVPDGDERGKYTLHRGRATLATLYAAAGMDIYDVQHLLGHKGIGSVKRYVRVQSKKINEAVKKADLVSRAHRNLDALQNKQAIQPGQEGEYLDVVLGYCKNSYGVNCAHYYACNRCDFFAPKEDAVPYLEQAKTNLLQKQASGTLTDDELTKVEEAIEVVDRLTMKLRNKPVRIQGLKK